MRIIVLGQTLEEIGADQLEPETLAVFLTDTAGAEQAMTRSVLWTWRRGS